MSNNKITNNNSILGDYEIVINNDKPVIFKIISFNSKSEKDIFVNNLKIRINLNYKNIIKLQNYNILNDTKIILEYEYNGIDMREDIQNKIISKNSYTINEIILIHNSLISCFYYLQNNGFYYGDIRPENILLNLKNNDVRLIDNLNKNYSVNSIQINNIRYNKNLYMSPLLFETITNYKDEVNHNCYKSDVFSLGVLLLEISLFQSVQNIYCFKNKTINESILSNYIKLLETKINSKTIVNNIKLMLTIDENRRPDFLDLHIELINNK